MMADILALLSFFLFAMTLFQSLGKKNKGRTSKSKKRKHSQRLALQFIGALLLLFAADRVDEKTHDSSWFSDIRQELSDFFSSDDASEDYLTQEGTVIINNNVPYFKPKDLKLTEPYHHNSDLDRLGRVGVADALITPESIPTEERGDISWAKPTGWVQRRYTNIGSGGWLYNRSHLIGYQLTGQDNIENLMTGTRWLNEQMLLYENWLAQAVEETGQPVRYRVTPVFRGDQLLAQGVILEGLSVADKGETVQFNIFIPNIQPGVEIDYQTGESVGPQGPQKEGQLSFHTHPYFYQIEDPSSVFLWTNMKTLKLT